MNGTVVGIFVHAKAGEPMQQVQEVEAVAGKGLSGDRYCAGEGSFNKGAQGKRQVSLINAIFFEGSDFEYADSRRNIVVKDVELMWLIGREFKIGEALFRGVKYCDPCEKPKSSQNKEKIFKEEFFDRGGLIAEVLVSGVIKTGDAIISPPKGY